MVSSLNKVVLIGNVGKDPEIRSIQDGREVASFPLATSESWKDKVSGERKEKTEWHKIVVFAQPLINIIKSYVHKGSKLYIEGSSHTRKWNDQNGTEKFTTEVVLQSFNSIMMLLDSRNSQSGHHDADGHKEPLHQEAIKDKVEYTVENIDDEIPF
jgi:single-strand DNA-binding protein